MLHLINIESGRGERGGETMEILNTHEYDSIHSNKSPSGNNRSKQSRLRKGKINQKTNSVSHAQSLSLEWLGCLPVIETPLPKRQHDPQTK